MIRFESLEKRFAGGTAGLAGVSFEIPRGQFCVVLGPSGAGKSTLLRCVNGLTTPTGGRVVVDGQTVGPATLRVLRPRIGMVHQDFNLAGRASVAANVLAGVLPKIGVIAALFGFFPRPYQRKACALLAEVGLGEEHLVRRASSLSGGQQQRVGIARAFMLDPEVILADEPVASLDPAISRDILRLIRDEARSRGASVLCSLHQIDLAKAFADRIVALRRGRIVFDGPPDGLSPEIIEHIYGPARIDGEAAPPRSEPPARPPADWRLPKPFDARTLTILAAAAAVLIVTGKRVEMDRMAISSAEALVTADSQVARGFASVGSQLWPPQISERIEAVRVEGLDPAHPPIFSHLETVETRKQTLDPASLEMRTAPQRTEYLVRPFGYLLQVAAKLLETVEIALWGTLLAILAGAPLALLGARNLAPHPAIAVAARALVGCFRAMPELISALLLVLAYGFGPVAGVLSLALYAAGFLGKFYAEDIENADPGPQEALTAIGAGRLTVLRYAILPQVMPQYLAYTFYIFDRNARMATVIGLAGAGGIGQELKGRYDMYHYHHVATILIAIFLLVFAVDQLCARLRRYWL